ncbi:DASH complex subunit Ask1-domain-containing protein [Aspergillus desertorum]
MSRLSSIAQRPLTLTEELEKLEQSITLTLQEIDHNFSRAHRIITTSILPVVTEYKEASRDVWEGAKFWKKFFEASANVHLNANGEEPNQDETTVDETLPEDESGNISQSHLTDSESYQTPSTERMGGDRKPDDLELTSLSLSSHSTPRAAMRENPQHDSTVTSSVVHPSPYDHDLAEDDEHFQQDDSYLPTTPGKQTSRGAYGHSYADNILSSSPFVPPVSHEKLTSGSRKGPVMHHFGDITYRVQATPMGNVYDPSRSRFAVTPNAASSTKKYAFEDSPISSPEPEAPQLNSELFSSPLKPQTPGTGRRGRPGANRSRAPPKPGTSVLTPAKGCFGKHSEWDSDDEQFPHDDADDDDELGLSPPKTMQFHIPQSRLMKTPAKEASRRIVEQLLFTAGANDTTEDLQDDQSPSVIRRVERLEDDTF